MRSSRSGRKTSTPSMRITSSTVSGISPEATRQAPTPSAAAAPMAIPASVIPRAIVFCASTHMVLLNSAHPRFSRSASRAPL